MIVVDNRYENGSPLPGDNLRVKVNLTLLLSRTGVTSAATTYMKSVSFSMPRPVSTTVDSGEAPNRETVELLVVTDFVDAWREYLASVSREINARYGANSSVVYSSSEGWVKLTIGGKGPSGVNDIFFYETAREIETRV